MGAKGGSGTFTTVPAPLSKLPLFHRGGSILTRRDIVRRAAPLMWKDPITIVVAVDRFGVQAAGDLYLDDGDSYDYQSGQLVWRGFKLSSGGSGYVVKASMGHVRDLPDRKLGLDVLKSYAPTYEIMKGNGIEYYLLVRDWRRVMVMGMATHALRLCVCCHAS